jgi:F0F1-type ATP synthase membrane subunit b/b'
MPCNKLLILAIALSLGVVCVSNSNAQEKKNPFADNIIGTLANPKMAAELELLEEQQESIKELMEEFGKLRHEVGQDMKEIWEAAGDEERKEIGEEYWRRVEEGRLEIVKQMKANLLPHQIDRVEQLSAQRMITEGKGRESAGLLSDQMINYLDIGEKQKQRIQDKSSKLKKEVTEKIQKILEDAKQELLAELNADQKKKYEKLLGDPVENESGGDDKDRKRRTKKR